VEYGILLMAVRVAIGLLDTCTRTTSDKPVETAMSKFEGTSSPIESHVVSLTSSRTDVPTRNVGYSAYQPTGMVAASVLHCLCDSHPAQTSLPLR
jgi:hypothetical protein